MKQRKKKPTINLLQKIKWTCALPFSPLSHLGRQILHLLTSYTYDDDDDDASFTRGVCVHGHCYPESSVTNEQVVLGSRPHMLDPLMRRWGAAACYLTHTQYILLLHTFVFRLKKLIFIISALWPWWRKRFIAPGYAPFPSSPPRPMIQIVTNINCYPFFSTIPKEATL